MVIEWSWFKGLVVININFMRLDKEVEYSVVLFVEVGNIWGNRYKGDSEFIFGFVVFEIFVR